MIKRSKGKVLFGTAVVSILGSATTGSTVLAEEKLPDILSALRDDTKVGKSERNMLRDMYEADFPIKYEPLRSRLSEYRYEHNFESFGYKNLDGSFLGKYKNKLAKQFGLESVKELPKFDIDKFNDYAQNEIKKANEERGKVRNYLFGTEGNEYIKEKHLKDYLEKYYEPAVLKSVKDKAYKKGAADAREELLRNNSLNTGNNSAYMSAPGSSIFGGFSSGISNIASTIKSKFKSLDTKNLFVFTAALAGSTYLLFFDKNDSEKANQKVDKKSKSYKSEKFKKINKKTTNNYDLDYDFDSKKDDEDDFI